jgi:aryl-alcohol dehydrogenase-like predicted oxidoreductase
MEMRRIGSLEVSVIGLGGNNFGTTFFGTACDLPAATRIIHAALDAGINFIGTGQSEEFIGAALGKRRNDVVIATKFSPYLRGVPSRAPVA